MPWKETSPMIERLQFVHDSQSGLYMMSELCERYGVAAVYVSHDVAVVGELARRVVVLYAGRAVELGEVHDVFGSPAHPYTRGLLRAVPSPDRAGHLVGMDGVPPRPGAHPEGCAFAPRCPIVVDECRVAVPDLAEASPGHVARCILVGTDRQVDRVSDRSSGSRAATAASASPILTIEHLDARYASTSVLHDVSFEIPQGSCVAVVGESGSGKTTLARCVVGLHTDWSGSIRFRGTDLTPGVHHRSIEQLRQVQYVFQNPYASLNPRRSVGGLVAQPVDHFGKLDRSGSDRSVRDAITSVALPVELVTRYPDQLSGGERQRVAIARTIAVEPALLVCDEVTSALDVSVQASVVEMLRRLQADHDLSLLFITHNLALVRSIAQFVIVMREGRVVEAGPVEVVLDDPSDPYSRTLMRDVPRFAGTIGP